MPATDLRITLVQSDIRWHEPDTNRAMFAEKIAPLKGKTDLIVLPEVFTSGFSMEADGFTEHGSPTSDWLIEQAKQCDAAVCGSTVYETSDDVGESGRTNRLLFATPDGEIQHYDKTHLFRMLGEHKRYVAGKQRVVVEWRGWRILLLVCYDLRFPVFCRNRQDYDLIVCVANWPAARRDAWRILLQARAVENQAFVAGVNRVGTDGNDLSYCGDSLLLGCKGEFIIDAEKDTEFVRTETISGAALESFRDSFQAWRDADAFDLRL